MLKLASAFYYTFLYCVSMIYPFGLF